MENSFECQTIHCEYLLLRKSGIVSFEKDESIVSNVMKIHFNGEEKSVSIPINKRVIIDESFNKDRSILIIKNYGVFFFHFQDDVQLFKETFHKYLDENKITDFQKIQSLKKRKIKRNVKKTNSSVVIIKKSKVPKGLTNFLSELESLENGCTSKCLIHLSKNGSIEKLREMREICFNDDNQHDAHEFLIKIISNVYNEYEETQTQNLNELRNPILNFEFELSTISECTNCNHKFEKIEKYRDLCLSFKSGLKHKNYDHSLQDILNGYFESEIVEDYKCSECYNLKAIKTVKIDKLSNYLILSLKRFEYETLPVRLDTHVQIGKYITFNENVYILKCIVNHIGSALQGHYFADVYDGKIWKVYDDDKPTNFNNDLSLRNISGYIYFYTKQEHLQ